MSTRFVTRFKTIHSGLLAIFALVALINLQTTPTLAQVLFGSMVGSIVDSSGAAVPNAVVRVTQLETNETRETQTNESGGFNLSTLKAGTYKVSILKEGFKAFYVENVAVSLNTTVRVDAKLEIGAQSQSVDITAESTLLQTEKADVHAEFSAKRSSTFRSPPAPLWACWRWRLESRRRRRVRAATTTRASR